MSCSVCCSSAAVSLTTLSVFERLAAKRPLVDLAVDSTREWYTKVLQLHIPNKRRTGATNSTTDLDDRGRGFTTHVVDSVLITKPVGTFDLFKRTWYVNERGVKCCPPYRTYATANRPRSCSDAMRHVRY